MLPLVLPVEPAVVVPLPEVLPILLLRLASRRALPDEGVFIEPAVVPDVVPIELVVVPAEPDVVPIEPDVELIVPEVEPLVEPTEVVLPAVVPAVVPIGVVLPVVVPVVVWAKATLVVRPRPSTKAAARSSERVFVFMKLGDEMGN